MLTKFKQIEKRKLFENESTPIYIHDPHDEIFDRYDSDDNFDHSLRTTKINAFMGHLEHLLIIVHISYLIHCCQTMHVSNQELLKSHISMNINIIGLFYLSLSSYFKLWNPKNKNSKLLNIQISTRFQRFSFSYWFIRCHK